MCISLRSALNKLTSFAVFTVALCFVLQSASAEPLDGAVITGSSVYSPEALFPLYRESLGHEADPLRTRSILANIESRYVQDGYLKPRLVMRDELLKEGILRVDVYEVRLTDVRISGDGGPHQVRIARLQQQLLAQPPLKQGTIALALERLRALPGLRVDARTQVDAATPNGVILLLHVVYQPISASVEWTNFGTQEIGPHFISTGVTANGLLGGREQLKVLLITATDYNNYHGAGLTFTTPLNDLGTTLSLNGFRSRSEPTFGGPPVELAFPHDVANLQLTQSLLATGSQTINAFIGYDYDDSIIRYEGVALESDRLRVAEAGLQFDGQVAGLPYGATIGVRHGLDAFGAGVATINGATLATNYTLAVGRAVLIVPWSGVFSSRISVLGQWTGDVLPYDERFKIGSDILARAFKTAEFAGDDGMGLKAEMRARILALSTRYGVPTLFGYSDYGEAWQHDVAAELHAATVGMGMKWDSAHLGASVEWAKPVAVSAGAPTDWTVLGDVTLSF